jgi:hypothetical protein
MRLILTGVAALAVSASAFAQEHPSSQTLDEQLNRVQNGQPAVSGNWNNSKKSAQVAAADPEMGQPSAAPAGERKPINAAAASQDTPRQRQYSAPHGSPEPMSPTVPRPAVHPMPHTVAPDGEVIESHGGGAIPALPLREQMSGNVRFITGGIGDEELVQLKSVEGQYNLRALLSAQQGEYISGAIVRLLGADGTAMVTSEDAGPYFYAQVPPGKYVMEVTSRSAGIKKVNVNVPASGFVKPHVVFAE